MYARKNILKLFMALTLLNIISPFYLSPKEVRWDGLSNIPKDNNTYYIDSHLTPINANGLELNPIPCHPKISGNLQIRAHSSLTIKSSYYYHITIEEGGSLEVHPNGSLSVIRDNTSSLSQLTIKQKGSFKIEKTGALKIGISQTGINNGIQVLNEGSCKLDGTCTVFIDTGLIANRGINSGNACQFCHSNATFTLNGTLDTYSHGSNLGMQIFVTNNTLLETSETAAQYLEKIIFNKARIKDAQGKIFENPESFYENKKTNF